MNIDEQRAFYPTADALRAMGQQLAGDVCLWTPQLARAYYNPHFHAIPAAPQSEAKRTRKPVTSGYVGVSLHRDRWFVAHWTVCGKVKTGHLRPNSDDGQRWAARDRARGLGVEYLALRDGTREPYLWRATEDMSDEIGA